MLRQLAAKNGVSAWSFYFAEAKNATFFRKRLNPAAFITVQCSRGVLTQTARVQQQLRCEVLERFQSIMNPTDRPKNEPHDGTFDPGVLDVESFLTEEQVTQLLAEYGELVEQDVFEDENADHAL
jgi:hypothetical protein